MHKCLPRVCEALGSIPSVTRTVWGHHHILLQDEDRDTLVCTCTASSEWIYRTLEFCFREQPG